MARQTYAQRIASATAKYLAANPGASEAEAKRHARGHGRTGEHGVTVTAMGADIVVTFRNPAKLAQAVRTAEKYGGRASVTIVGKNGRAVTAFGNSKHMPGRTLDSIKAMSGGGQSFYSAVGQSGGDHYDLDEAIGGEGDVAEYQLIVH